MCDLFRWCYPSPKLKKFEDSLVRQYNAANKEGEPPGRKGPLVKKTVVTGPPSTTGVVVKKGSTTLLKKMENVGKTLKEIKTGVGD